MKIEPMTTTAHLESGEMTAAWMLQSGQPAESPLYDGGHHVPRIIRAGIELSMESGGRRITRTLDLADAQVLRDALDAHIRNINPPELPRGYRRLRDNPQA